MARDRAPDFVLDIGLAALVDCHQAHAEWMLERSSRQLGCIVDLLGRIAHDEDDRIATDAAAQAALLAYRRALFVRGELKVATEQYSRQTQRPAPLHVEQALKKAKDAFERAQVPLKCIEELIGCGGHVTLRRTLWRWRGDAHGAALVFLKLHEAERALAERRSTRFIHDRFRLLERALDQAGGGSRTALTPAKRHCAYALQRINEERWTPRRQDRVHRLLIREMYWLYRRMKMSQPGVPPRTGQSRHVPAGPLGKSAERNIATTPG